MPTPTPDEPANKTAKLSLLYQRHEVTIARALDHWVNRPAQAPAEEFHHSVTEFLREWGR